MANGTNVINVSAPPALPSLSAEFGTRSKMDSTKTQESNGHATKLMSTDSAAKNDGEVDGDGLVCLDQMRELSRTREMTRAQYEVVALAFCNYNLLMRGPANTGKRWIARRAGSLIGRRFHNRKTETVEIMSKWFTVTAAGQIIIDEAALPVAMEQLRRATVLIIENVPCHPQAAARFFAHLNFICKVERCKARTISATNANPSGAATASVSVSHTADGPAQAPFGGIQIIATQNDAPIEHNPAVAAGNLVAGTTMTGAPQVFWSDPVTVNGPPPQSGPCQLGLLVTTAAPIASNPHDAVLVINFR